MVDLSKYAAGRKKYLSKDLYAPNQGEVLTIANIREVEFSDRGGKTEQKLVVDWVEDRPSMTLNKGNLAAIMEGLGAQESDYKGARVKVWHDPNVMLRGEAVGGLRISTAKRKTEAQPPKEEFNDEIPF